MTSNRTLSVIAAMGELAVAVRQLAISVSIGSMNQALEDTDKVSSALLRIRNQLIEARH